MLDRSQQSSISICLVPLSKEFNARAKQCVKGKVQCINDKKNGRRLKDVTECREQPHSLNEIKGFTKNKISCH